MRNNRSLHIKLVMAALLLAPDLARADDAAVVLPNEPQICVPGRDCSSIYPLVVDSTGCQVLGRGCAVITGEKLGESRLIFVPPYLSVFREPSLDLKAIAKEAGFKNAASPLVELVPSDLIENWASGRENFSNPAKIRQLSLFRGPLRDSFIWKVDSRIVAIRFEEGGATGIGFCRFVRVGDHPGIPANCDTMIVNVAGREYAQAIVGFEDTVLDLAPDFGTTNFRLRVLDLEFFQKFGTLLFKHLLGPPANLGTSTTPFPAFEKYSLQFATAPGRRQSWVDPRWREDMAFRLNMIESSANVLALEYDVVVAINRQDTDRESDWSLPGKALREAYQKAFDDIIVAAFAEACGGSVSKDGAGVLQCSLR
jgi:hypothetical protein